MTLRLQQTSEQESWSRIVFSKRTLSQSYKAKGGPLFRGARAAVATALISSLLFVSAGDAFAQGGPSPQGPPPPAAAYVQLQFAELDQLVAPIALYPDALVAQILAASTYGPQVVEAQSFVIRNGGAPPQELARIVDVQPWDPSVKALTAFPAILLNLSTNYTWTTRLGDAYFNQPQDVMAAVQTMRQRAYAAGTLRNSPQETVVYSPGNIVVAPINPDVVYVPVYNPWVVYGAPVPVYAAYVAPPPPSGGTIVAAAAIGFTAGVMVAAFSSYGWGCNHWSTNWRSHSVYYNHAAYVSRGNYGGGYRGGYGYRTGYGYSGYRGGGSGGYNGSGGYRGGSGNNGGSANNGGSGYRGGSGSGPGSGNSGGSGSGSGEHHGGGSGSGSGTSSTAKTAEGGAGSSGAQTRSGEAHSRHTPRLHGRK
jgi:hypothetical protein